jgi:hypothetical protein
VTRRRAHRAVAGRRFGDRSIPTELHDQALTIRLRRDDLACSWRRRQDWKVDIEPNLEC